MGIFDSSSDSMAFSTKFPPRNAVMMIFSGKLFLISSMASAVASGCVMACGVRITRALSTSSLFKTVPRAKLYLSAVASPRTSTGLLKLAAGGSLPPKAPLTSAEIGAIFRPYFSMASAARIPGPPALVITTTFGPFG